MTMRDPEALAARWELLAPHRDRVISILRRRRVDYAEVEDVVHEAMLRLAQWDRLDREHAGGALLTVAYRVAIDKHRRHGRERSAAARFGAVANQLPDEIAVDRLEARHLAGVLSTLSWRERRALAGRAQGVPPRETAAGMGVSARSLHLALSRARATLRAAAGGSWVVVLVEWLRRHATQHVAQPVTMVATGAVVALSLAAPLPGVASPAATLPSSAAPSVAGGAHHHRSTAPAPKPGATTAVIAAAAAGAVAPAQLPARLPSVIEDQLRGALGGVATTLPNPVQVISIVASTLAHAQAPAAQLPAIVLTFPAVEIRLPAP